MHRLIIHHHYGTCEGDSGEYVIPFEYESVESFIFDVLDGKLDLYKRFGIVRDLDNDILDDVYTLDEWFEKNKE